MNHNEKVKELLAFGEVHLKHIQKLVGQAKFTEVYEYIASAEPPVEWFIEVPESKSSSKTAYRYIPLFLMEEIMNEIFDDWGDRLEGNPIFVSDKGRFAVTSITEVGYGFSGHRQYLKRGIATVIADRIDELQAKVPYSRKAAMRNAIKDLGKLFGRHLAQDLQDENGESSKDAIVKEPQDADAEFNRLLTAVKEAATKSEAQAIIDGATGFKAALGYNNEVKASINSKPE